MDMSETRYTHIYIRDSVRPTILFNRLFDNPTPINNITRIEQELN
jgi:hypothetical protein